MSFVNEGKYTAKIKDYGIGTTKEGQPKAMIIFTFKDEKGLDQELVWSGSFKEGKAREITIDALLTCGLKGDNPLAMVGGIETGILNADQEVQIQVKNELYNDKTYSKIAWINKLGGRMFQDKVDVQKFAGLNLKADVVARRKETGIKDDGVPF